MQEEVLNLFRARRGHFVFESGHHGDLWLDLELLLLQPKRVQPFAGELARRLAEYRIEAICGPLIEGAFVGLMVAQRLDVDFFYTEPFADSAADELFPVKYRLPNALRQGIAGKRVAIVNDVINAGSAVRGTYEDLNACGANTVVLATLLSLGDSPKLLADQWDIDLVTIGSQPNSLFTREQCSMCADEVPLDNA